jgi:uncharacterized protein (TIRG00374 family)
MTNIAKPPAAGFRITRTQQVILVASVVLYGAGAFVVYRHIDTAVLRMAQALPLALIAALLGLSFLNYTIRAWRWVVLGNYLGFRVPLRDNVLYYLAGYSLTSTPGKAGEAVRLWFLKSGHGVPYTKSLPLMLADRIIDMWAVLILALLSCAGFTAYAWQGLLLGLLVVAVSIPILWPLRFKPVLLWLYKLAPRRGRLLARAHRTARALAHLVSWRTYGVTLLPSIAGWFAECAALYLLLQHLGAPISVANAVFVFSFSMIVGAASMLPGGLGSTEATIVLLLKAIGVDLDVALAATAIVRITTFWFAVAIGAALMPAALQVSARAASTGRLQAASAR